MDKLKIRFDPTDNTLIVWCDDPSAIAYLSPIEEEAPGERHLIKNEAGQASGLSAGFINILQVL